MARQSSPRMKRLSIIIVAKNEAINIADCVRSAQFADEVIVLDSGSSDGTAELVDDDTEIRPGDQVLAVLRPGKEDELRSVLLRK